MLVILKSIIDAKLLRFVYNLNCNFKMGKLSFKGVFKMGLQHATRDRK
jgi:hypothetical protein